MLPQVMPQPLLPADHCRAKNRSLQAKIAQLKIYQRRENISGGEPRVKSEMEFALSLNPQI
jgi:hypothetical protein